MIGSNHEFGGVAVTVFYMSKGEIVSGGPHQHTWVHTTAVSRGKTKVTVNHATFEMSPGMRDMELPAYMDHEIVALEDDTVIVQMMKCGKPPEHAWAGGILKDDGTVHFDYC